MKSEESLRKSIDELEIAIDKLLVDAKKVKAERDALLSACIESLSLFDNYPACHESVGTYQIITRAIDLCMEANYV